MKQHKKCRVFSFSPIVKKAQVMDELQSVFQSMRASAAGSDMEIGPVSPQTGLSRAASSTNTEMRC